MDQTILTIAKVARSEMERFSIRDDLHTYNNPDLACLCAVSSWFLRKLASKFNVSVKCVMGYYDMNRGRHKIYKDDINHVWNVFKNKDIIDITATQFDDDVVTHNKVHLTTVADYTYHPRRKVINKRSFNSWMFDQSPYAYESVLIKEYLPTAIAKVERLIHV